MKKNCFNCDYWIYATNHEEPFLIGYCRFYRGGVWMSKQSVERMGSCNEKHWENTLEVKLENKGW